MKLTHPVGFILLILFISSNLNATEVGLNNVYWRAVSLASKKLDLGSEEIPHIAFHEQENRVAGFGGCNRFFATYQQLNGSLQISIMGGGRAQCPELGNLEAEFLSALQSTQQFSIANNTLILMNGSDVLIEFVGVEP